MEGKQYGEVHVDVVVNFSSQVIFIFSFVSTSLAYSTMPKNKEKISWDKNLTIRA